MPQHKTCDGVTRRDAIRFGALGVGGLTLSNYLRLASAGEIRQGAAKAAIFIELEGGPSHLDTFDMKPEAPTEIRGTFQPIATKVPGLQICEHLPKIAACADKLTVIRGVSHTLAAHALGREYVSCGSRPLPSIKYPGYGSVVSKELPGTADMPKFVAIPRTTQRPGFLGVQYAPLNTAATPRPGQPFEVRGISLSNRITVEQLQRRQELLRDLDNRFAAMEQDDQLMRGLTEFDQQAFDIITSPTARKAFDISREAPAFAKPFGVDPFGLSCLLGVRLVESGVRFVTLSLGGWDTHTDNFTRLKNNQLPKLDTGLSALLNGLDQRGLLDSTAVFVTGEFGRTPKINSRSAEGGRDHFARCMFMLMAGGNVRGGQVLGASNDTASAPAHEAYSPDDVAASFYHNLGIDPQTEYHTDTGRPITLVRDGNIIPSLFT
jgi:hypothetical protein